MITKYQASQVQNYIFGKQSFTPTDKYYLGLSKASIDEEGQGLDEPTGAGYARVAIENNKTNWSTTTDGSVTNEVAIEFNESLADWGVCTHVFLADAEVGGNILYVSELNIHRDITAYSQLYFAQNGIEFNLTSK